MSIYDHAANRFHAIVASVLSPVEVVWSRYQGEITYPWCRLQIVNGPVTVREQKRRIPLIEVEVVINAGSAGDQVNALIGGRYIGVSHTGVSSTTAVAFAAKAPAHWDVSVVGSVITIRGSDVFGAIEYEGVTLSTSSIGEPQWVEVLRREALVQCTIWCRIDRDTGRPARWDANGCDTMALRVQTALRQVEPDPYRVYIRPESNLRPFDESYKDGNDYIGVTFDSMLTWVDIDQEFLFGEPIETIESVDGTIETADGVIDPIIDEFDVSIDD